MRPFTFLISPILNAPKLIENLKPDRAAEIVREISADSRAEIFRKLPEQAHAKCMARLDDATRHTVTHLISYPPQSAGGIMTTEFLSVPADWTVEQALKLVQQVGEDKETVYVVYVTDPLTKQLTQVVSLRQLMTSDPKSTVLSIASNRLPITVKPLTDREEVARLISKYNLLAVPVLAEDRHILGIVTVDDVIDAGLYDYGPHWPDIALTVGIALAVIVTWGSMTGSMLPFILKSFRFDPATASAPFVATLVDVTGLVIYFSVALLVLRGTLL